MEEGTHDELLLYKSPRMERRWHEAERAQYVRSGFYDHQWTTQFAEKGIITHRLQEKILNLQAQIESHQRDQRQRGQVEGGRQDPHRLTMYYM